MSSDSEKKPEPTVITLDPTNSIQILIQYIELAQQKGAYILSEAELLKRSGDVLANKVPDAEITEATARQLLIQGIHKGQRHGAYTLNDAALLSKVVQYVTGLSGTPAPAAPTPTPPSQTAPQPEVAPASNSVDDLLDDLADLAEPIPLKPKEV